MNKIYAKLLSLAFLAFSLFGLTACELYIGDDSYYPHGGGDRQRANVISGEWEGNFGMYYTIANPYTGQATTFDANYTYVRFMSNYPGARSGTGQQIDFYRSGPYEYQYYRFLWEVRNGVLYLTYPQDHNLDVAIYDYYLSDRYFSGRMGDSNFAFQLGRLSYNHWNRFSGDYMYGVYDSWDWGSYYSPKRQLDGHSTPSNASTTPPEILSRGRK